MVCDESHCNNALEALNHWEYQVRPPQPDTSAKLDPLRFLEYPVAIFVINITAFVIVWKGVGLSWMPLDLDERFQEVFSMGYYPRDMETRETEYNLFFLMLYGILGTAAQLASFKIASVRRSPHGQPGVYRYIFATFHLLIAIYHVLFVFQVIKGKMILDGMALWQMYATKALYVAELVMACELLFAKPHTFFRRKVCLDVVSAFNLLPFLIYWSFAIAGFNNPSVNKLIEYTFFSILPLALLLLEWSTWLAMSSSATVQQEQE